MEREPPLRIQIEPQTLGKALVELGYPPEFVSSLKINIYQSKDITDSFWNLVFGKGPLGRTIIGSKTVSIYSQRIHENWQGKREYVKKLVQSDPIQKSLAERGRELFLRLIFTGGREGEPFFLGNKTRRENYINLAKLGSIPQDRAIKFLQEQVDRIYKGRIIPETLLHEIEHIYRVKSDIAKNVFSGISCLAVMNGVFLASNWLTAHLSKTDEVCIRAITVPFALVVGVGVGNQISNRLVENRLRSVAENKLNQQKIGKAFKITYESS